MKKLIVANWKMNPASKDEAVALFESIKKGASNQKAEVIICPPFIYLPLLNGLKLGAQTVFFEEKGAFTGEISPLMLKDLGVEWAIIGHSEQRKMGETDETVNKKIKKSLEDGLKVIFCIGETQAEKEAGEREGVLKRQISKGLESVTDLKDVVIAYEPVWAIGTGNSCSPEETKSALDFVRQQVQDVGVLYGGSVNAQNAESYIKEANADGLLVGGASLKAEEFIKIIQSVE